MEALEASVRDNSKQRSKSAPTTLSVDPSSPRSGRKTLSQLKSILVDTPYTIKIRRVGPRRMSWKGRWIGRPWRRASATSTSSPPPRNSSSQQLDTVTSRISPSRQNSKGALQTNRSAPGPRGTRRRHGSFFWSLFGGSDSKARNNASEQIFSGEDLLASIYDGTTSVAVNLAEQLVDLLPQSVVSHEEAMRRIHSEVEGLKARCVDIESLAKQLRKQDEPSKPALLGRANSFFGNVHVRRRRPSLVRNPHSSQQTSPQTLNTMREAVVKVHAAADVVSGALFDLTPDRLMAGRSDSLLTLEEHIGNKPNHSWTTEWVDMVCEFHQMADRPVKGASGLESARPSEMATADLKEWIKAHLPLATYKENFKKDITDAIALGWAPSRAEIFISLSYVKSPLARAMREGDCCYAASTYALCDTFFEQQEAMRTQGRKAPRLYTHLKGLGGLEFNEPLWETLLVPDDTGFRGHTCTSLVTADCDPKRMDEHGHKAYDPAVGHLTAQQSDVVCFEPRTDDQLGAHSPVMFDEMYGAFPPNTLFRLSHFEHAGTWEGPGGIRPNQRLLVVTATFRKASPTQVTMTSKMTGSTVTLSYGDRESFVRGLNDISTKTALTMELEFDREMEWVDWKGTTYSLKGEWDYVSGAAVPKQDCTPGFRDEGNGGKSPGDFMQEVNAFIARRRALSWGTRLPQEHAFLNLEEVKAVRLYSGPAFQPINEFLREVAKLSTSFRLRVAHDPRLSFCATVQHIINAIRKLAAVVTDAEAARPLWRGVRGELPNGFWTPDQAGMVCAVEMGFMSTSRRISTPLKYMEGYGSPNVLWALKPMPETDDAFHCGADISILSQFKAEEEILFPPCTLLIVKVQSANANDELKKLAEEQSSGHSTDHVKGWQLVRASLSEIIGRRGLSNEDTEQGTARISRFSVTSPADAAVVNPQNSRESMRYGNAAEVFIKAETRVSTSLIPEESEIEKSEMSTSGLDISSSSTPDLMSFVGSLGTKTLEVLASPLSFGRSLYSGEVASEPQSSSSALGKGSFASSTSPPSSPLKPYKSRSNNNDYWGRRVSWAGAGPGRIMADYHGNRSRGSQSMEAPASPLPDKSMAIKNKFSSLMHSRDHIHRKGKHLHNTVELEGKTFVHIQVSPSFI